MSRVARLTLAFTLCLAFTPSMDSSAGQASGPSAIIGKSALPLLGIARSRRGELRGVRSFPGESRDWDAIAKSLRDSGFSALFFRFSTGGAAFYPSTVLPAALPVAPARDELAQAVRAARAQGLELHAWHSPWALDHAPLEFLDELRRAGRLQRNRHGQLGRGDPEVLGDWLCPSNPENRKLGKEAVLEIVRNYDVAGIQFDDMRFPNADYCFCDHCKERFQSECRVVVERWPDDVLPGGLLADRWQSWRCELLTSFVAEIRAEIRRIKPQVFVSLVAQPDVQTAASQKGQDWVAWARDGLLDFVCPMDCAGDAEQLTGWLLSQVEAIQGAVPVYAGLGSFMGSSPRLLAEQVQVARSCGADGFVASASPSSLPGTWLADLKTTVNADDPYPMPHWSPPAAFAFSGPATAPPASKTNVIAGAPLTLHIAIGPAAPEESDEEDSGGADQAASILRRATEARSPVATYEPAPGSAMGFGERPRVSGRIVAETPGGLSLLTLGAFDTDFRFARTLRFTAPAGLFRVAIYGEARDENGSARAFVRRSPLMVGVSEQELTGRPPGADHRGHAGD